jgi:hypothetical protein
MNDYYKPTQKEIIEFNRDKKGYLKPFLATKTIKPTHGQLIWFECGKSTVLHYNKTFSLLNYLKKQMISQGYDSKKLLIKNM